MPWPRILLLLFALVLLLPLRSDDFAPAAGGGLASRLFVGLVLAALLGLALYLLRHRRPARPLHP